MMMMMMRWSVLFEPKIPYIASKFFFFFLVSFGVSKSITNPFLIHVVLTEFYKNLILKKNYTFTSKIIFKN